MTELIQAQNRAREYEAIYVLRPDVDNDAATSVANRLSEVIARENGKLTKVESWGRRKLAYPVRKYRRGIYVYLKFVGTGNIVAEFERNLRMHREAVLKFMTVKINDEVDASLLQIIPEDVAFAEIEPIAPEELHESREKQLGLVESELHARSRRHNEDEDVDRDFSDGDHDDFDDDADEVN